MIGPRGGLGAVNLRIIVVRVCEPVFRNLPQSYTWPLKNRTLSYTWSSKMLAYSYTALWFLYPFIAGNWTNIAINSLNTKRTSSLDKSLSKKNIRIYRDVRKVGPFTYESRKNGSVIYFLVEKKKLIIYLAALKKGAPRHAHPYYVIYRKLPIPRSPPHPHFLVCYNWKIKPDKAHFMIFFNHMR